MLFYTHQSSTYQFLYAYPKPIDTTGGNLGQVKTIQNQAPYSGVIQSENPQSSSQDIILSRKITS